MLMYVVFFLFHIASILSFFLLPVPSEVPALHFLDVGQGDATLLITQQQRIVLIDGGGSSAIVSPLSHALPPFVRKIDLIFLSHPHADHMEGLLAVLDRYDVGALILTGVQYESMLYTRLYTAARSKNVLILQTKAGEFWRLDDGIFIEILFPFTSLKGEEFRNVNNSSIVFLLHTPKERCLFVGDMEIELEQILARYYGRYLNAHCLKVGHHGSKTSSSKELLQFIRPREMFISVGKKNTYGHPSRATLKNLCTWGKVFRTDEHGTIKKSLLY